MYYFFLFIITLFPSTNYSNRELLIGFWNSEGRISTTTEFYQKVNGQIQGKNLEFKADGSFIDRNIQPCGSDGAIHQYEGKWKIDKNNVIQIFDLIEIYNKAHYYLLENKNDVQLQKTGKFQIIKISKNELVIKRVINYEILVNKN